MEFKIKFKRINKQWNTKGMMTVEASVIVPAILIIIVTELFFCLFLIDMAVAKSEALRLAVETAAVWKTDGDLTDGTYKTVELINRSKTFLRKNSRAKLTGKAKIRLQKRMQARLNVSTIESCKVEVFKDKVYTSVSLYIPVHCFNHWKFRCKGEAVLSNEEEIMRKVVAGK
mgnify:CR=1 FL=1